MPTLAAVINYYGTLPMSRTRLFGSAPRVRGTRRPVLLLSDQSRFSPAYAGNTSHSCITAMSMSVQPRVCGEHIGKKPPKPPKAGSAPRMRGTLFLETIVIEHLFLCQKFYQFFSRFSEPTQSYFEATKTRRLTGYTVAVAPFVASSPICQKSASRREAFAKILLSSPNLVFVTARSAS